MAITDSTTGKIRQKYSVAELEEAARLMRGYNLVALCAAGSGHSGGTMSIMDITAALYLHNANLDPQSANWDGRDRIIWSTGHKAPSLYLGLAMAGFCELDDVVRLRRLWSPFQGHPHWHKLPGVEVSSGSLGQGLSIAVGMALAARLDGKKHHVFSIHGDGEQQEGQIWEAAMEAGHFQLDNLTAIIDINRLQIDGWVKDVMDIDPLADRYRAFGWHVVEIDGHDMAQVVKALDEAKTHQGSPTAILANTVKGKGISFMENVAGWHGKSPNKDQMIQGLEELGLKDKIPWQQLLDRVDKYQAWVDKELDQKQPKFSKNYWWNQQDVMKAKMDPTRMGFGRALKKLGDDERIVCIGMDISGSITISQFYEDHPERQPRWISVGIAEQSGTAMAAGLAREGKIPVLGNYAVFSSGRNLDQVRTSVAYGDFNVLIAGAHGGVSVGPDGATHQALEDIFNMVGIPGMHISVPADSVETEKATAHLLFQVQGPKYIRFAREATPVISTEATPFKYGEANVIRLRSVKESFLDSFETVLASQYTNENENLTIIACGPEVPEAMRAAWILKTEYGLETRVINMHTIKPLDREAVVRAAVETGVIVTAEEHQVGGLGNLVASAVLQDKRTHCKCLRFGMIGVLDRFGESGAPWELIKEFELSAEHIARKAKELVG
ncbi:MAG: transketolase [Candidatus Zixiibacteriota bacterium]|nr:MAG: transketolase [candidate division Zixibacteria bacterium]